MPSSGSSDNAPARGGSPTLNWGRAKVVEVFGADLRSLAAFRVVLAFLVLADLAARATDLYSHYSDDGVLPRDQLLEKGVLDKWEFSLNLVNGELLFQALIFGVGALAALGLLAGYRTRLMTVVAWVVLISIQHRNPLVLNAGDTLLRLLLFWGMFLPLGAHWSVDRARKAAAPRLAMHFLSLATVGLFMQIAFMYWFTALLKTGDEWRVDGSALYYALHLDEVVSPTGAYLAQFPEVLRVMTFATLGLEALGPFLLFCPFFTGPIRTALVLAFVGLHAGIWTMMDIGLFPWISALCMVCFLPAWFWDRGGAKLRASFPKLPDVARRGMRAATSLGQTRLLPLETRFSTRMGQPSSLVAAAHGDQPRNRAARGMEPPAVPEDREGNTPALGARAEGREVRRGAGEEPAPVVLRSSLAVNLLASFFLVYIFCLNLTTVSTLEMPEPLESVASSLGIGQSWSMFAPYPRKTDTWYVIPGTLRDGRQVDLMAVTRNDFSPPEGVSWKKPRSVSYTYENNHWRKYMNNLADEDNEKLRPHFGRYVCGEWNTRNGGPDELMTLDLVQTTEETLPDYRRAELERRLLWEHDCF